MNKVGAWRRYFRWQIGSRLIDCPVILPFVDEAVLVVERGMTGATGNVYAGLHEFEPMALILHYITADDLFLDIGANVGTYSVLAARIGGARVICFEPNAEVREKLMRNLAVNGLLERCEVRSVAVANTTGEVIFSTDCGAKNQIVDENYPGHTSKVNCMRLDDVSMPSQPTICKIDVEGFEAEVLDGAERTFGDASLQVVIMENNSQSLEDRMHAWGFSEVVYDPIHRAFQCGKPEPAKTFLVPVNHVWVRNIDEVLKRCKAGRHFTVHGVNF